MAITVDSYIRRTEKNPDFTEFFSKHLNSLGIKSTNVKQELQKYKTFCSDNGFKNTLNKSWIEFSKETKLFNWKKAGTILVKDYYGKDIRKFIEKSLIPATYKERTEGGGYTKGRIADAITSACKHMLEEDQDVYLNLLLHIEKYSKMLTVSSFVNPLARLTYYNHYWINDYKNWKPSTHNMHKQFSSLLRFLLCKYEMPKFMDSAWYNSSEAQEKMFIHIAKGKNIRTAENLPFPLTKKMAHYFSLTPDHYDINTAFHWAKILAMGGDERTVEALRDTKIIRDNSTVHKDIDKFKESIITFFIDNPMLDTEHYNPIVDYVWYVKYEPRREFIERGVAVDLPPLQPNFSMNGRTPDSLLKQVERWHRQLGKEKKGTGVKQWEHRKDVKDYSIQFGTSKKKNVRFYNIRELLSTSELGVEGRSMSNCVASYSRSCAGGRTSIWSLTKEDHQGVKHLVTIEVDKEKVLRQAKGPRNAMPSSNDKSIIRRWTSKEGLTIPSYLS